MSHSRTRTQGKISNPKTYERHTLFNGSVTTSSPNDNFYCLRRGKTKVTHDIVTDRYRSRIAAGEIVNNPFFSKEIEKSHGYTGWHVRRTSGSSSNIQDYECDLGYRDCPNYGSPPNVDASAVIAEASTAALAGILQPDLEGLVDVAEANKTLSSFTSRVDKVNRWIRRLPRFGREVSFLANNWLRYRYGIMPAIYSANSALGALGKKYSQRLTSRGSASASGTSTATSSNQGAFYKLDWNHTHTVTVSSRAGVLYEYFGSYPKWGFSASEIPAAAWELTPWSFAVDWVTNAGDYIRALTPKAGVRQLASWCTTWTTHDVESVMTSQFIGSSGGLYTSLQDPTGSESWHSVTKNRTTGISASLVFKEGSVKKTLSSKRALDALALLHGLLQK